MSLAWIIAALSIVSDALDILRLITITEAAFSSVLFLGSLIFLSEELGWNTKHAFIYATPP